MSLGKLSPSERLLIDRRRRKETQAKAARRHGVSQSRYSRWERGLDHPGSLEGRNIWSPKTDFRLRDHERCLLFRRRAGVIQAMVAEALGRCKMWVRQMERGEVSSDELLRYWEG